VEFSGSTAGARKSAVALRPNQKDKPHLTRAGVRHNKVYVRVPKIRVLKQIISEGEERMGSKKENGKKEEIRHWGRLKVKGVERQADKIGTK